MSRVDWSRVRLVDCGVPDAGPPLVMLPTADRPDGRGVLLEAAPRDDGGALRAVEGTLRADGGGAVADALVRPLVVVPLAMGCRRVGEVWDGAWDGGLSLLGDLDAF